MKIRTDLAMEAESFTTATGKLQGIKVTEKKEDDITITRMDILNHTGEEIIGKTMGTYITIDAPMLSDLMMIIMKNIGYHSKRSKGIGYRCISLAQQGSRNIGCRTWQRCGNTGCTGPHGCIQSMYYKT